MLESLLTPFLAKYAPAVFSWAVSGVAKAVIGEKTKALLKDRSQRHAYLTAVQRAFSDFAKEFPELASSFFDEHFLRSSIADELLKFLSRNGFPDKSKIIEAYSRQFSANPQKDISAAVDAFLELVENHCKSEKSLQELLTNRQSEDSYRILRKIEDCGFGLSAQPLQAGHINTGLLDTGLVVSAFKAASQNLLDWPQTLGEKHWIDRPELARLMERIEGTDFSVSLLLGTPGSGKSALLSRLAGCCINRDWVVLAIKADQLPEELATLDGIRTLFELPAPVLDCMREVAKTKKVVLLIDQLDALSELIDLKTQRLSILLRLITISKNIHNVHIISSCRNFDRGYDKRLNSIEAEEIQLELPRWEVVEKLLETKGITSGGWPESFREILRAPQCLKLFLRHFSGTAELRIFDSYQAMLEHLWTSRLFGASGIEGASELLHEIATEMAEREVMFVPSAKYDANRKALDYVVGAGILQYDHTGRQISFTHQTIFDFARARAFIAKEQSLSRYVLARQTGLFVRPKLWSALHYLRGSDPTTYRNELTMIWKEKNLRPHLRMLIIDFVGQQEEPVDFETQTLRPIFSDQTYAPNALAAVAGRKAWFDLISVDILPAAMLGSTEMAWSVIRVLEAAWPFAQERILDLIKTHWLPDVTKHHYAWHSLRGLQQWNPLALEVAIAIIARGDIHNNAAQDLASLISVSEPDLAPEIVGAQIRKQVAAGILAQRPRPESTPDDTDQQRLATLMKHHSDDPLRRIIESHNEWHDLAAIAEAAPKAYLEQVWPSVRLIIEAIAKEDTNRFIGYREDHLLATHMEVDERKQSYEHPLMDSFVYAVRALARQDSTHFHAFVEANQVSESMTVQRLLALGLCETTESAPQFVLDYLLADSRRLSLENFHEDERETKMLLRRLVPHLEDSDCYLLEQHILKTDLYRDIAAEKDPKDRQRLAKYSRQFRLRLLLQFPKERLSKSTQNLIDSEGRIFSNFKDERREVEMLATKSAMRADVMEKASEKTLEKFLAAFPDSTEWGDHFHGHGGSIEVSREFAQFAKKDTQKAILLIHSLDPNSQQRPAAYAIRELDESELPDQELFKLVISLDAKGFSGIEFRQCVADALRKRVKNSQGIPDIAIDLLERWIDEYPIDVKEKNENYDSNSSDHDEREESLLWGLGGMRVLPHGSYPLLNAYFFGLIARDPVPSKRLLDALWKHLSRGDHIEIWDAMAGDALSRVRYCEHDAAQAFLDELFATYPELLEKHAGALLVAHSLTWVSHDLTKSWILQVSQSPMRRAHQTYGELLVLRSVLSEEDAWSRNEIAKILTQAKSGIANDFSPLCGLVYGAANLWRDTKDRSLLRSILCIGMDSSIKNVATAAVDWFRIFGELQFDADTQPILEAFASGRSLETAGGRSYALDRISELIDEAPELVYRISNRLLNIYKDEVGNFATSSVLEAESLLSIALTLQRLEEPHRTRGLELFEKLLHYNAYKARDVLRDIDRRPGSAMPATQLRRRRRKTSQTRKH